MIPRFALISISAAMVCTADENHSGRATADWIAVSASARPGQPLQTAIRIVHDKGWHSYWLNPGEAGMPTEIHWKLPPGWKAAGIKFPVPIRFLTGGLAGYGYEGALLLPVALTPPADFAGRAKLEADLSWLACSEEGCVPGNAKLAIEITAGDGQPGEHANEILAAIDRVPRPAVEALRLEVVESEKILSLMLFAGNPAPVDLPTCEVFPLTKDLIDPKTVIRFAATGDKWTATVAKSEFAEAPVRELALVLADGKNPPMEVRWRAGAK